MTTKWTAERRAKFKRTMARRRAANDSNGSGNGAAHVTEGLPPELERALERHYRQKILAELAGVLGK